MCNCETKETNGNNLKEAIELISAEIHIRTDKGEFGTVEDLASINKFLKSIIDLEVEKAHAILTHHYIHESEED